MSKKDNKTRDLERRTRNFCAVLYPDCAEHMTAFETLLNDASIQLCGILHDRDTYNEDSETHKAGERKKEHYHLVIELKNPRTRNGMARELGVNKQAFEPCESLKKSKRYLMHLDDDDKTLYELDEVFGNNVESVVKLITGKEDENLSASRIIDYLDSCDHEVTLRQLLRFCADNRLWALYRRAQYTFNALRIEHNEKLTDVNYTCEVA